MSTGCARSFEASSGFNWPFRIALRIAASRTVLDETQRTTKGVSAVDDGWGVCGGAEDWPYCPPPPMPRVCCPEELAALVSAGMPEGEGEELPICTTLDQGESLD